MSQLFQVLDKEQKIEDNWHLRARVTRPKQDHVYIIYDPQDVRLATNLKADISRRGMKVLLSMTTIRVNFCNLNNAIASTNTQGLAL